MRVSIISVTLVTKFSTAAWKKTIRNRMYKKESVLICILFCYNLMEKMLNTFFLQSELNNTM